VTRTVSRPANPKYPKQLNTLGDHIRKRRLDLGLSQKHAGREIGVDEETIFRWESNESRPQVQFIPAIIKFLGYNPVPLPDSQPDRLIFCRRLLGLSQRKLATKIGIDPKALGLCERGKRLLSKRLLKLLESF
jgi:transcriptional regulator with XRE-family HTH domain